MDKIYARLFHVIKTCKNPDEGIRSIEKMIKKGANVNFKDKNSLTPLMVAASSHEPELIKALLKHGAIVDDQTCTGATALWAAVRARNLQAVQILIDHHAHVDMKVTKPNRITSAIGHETPLSLICDNYLQPTVCDPIIKLLVQHGADINFSDNNGNTILMNSIRLATTDVEKSALIKLLLDLGADYTRMNHKGKTAMDTVNTYMKLFANKNGFNPRVAEILTAYMEKDKLNNMIEGIDDAHLNISF